MGVRWLTVGIMVFALFSCDKNLSGDPSWSKVRQKGNMVIGVDRMFPPMTFEDSAGKITGFDAELATLTAKKMGIKVVFMPVDWNQVVTLLTNGTIDLIWSGFTVTEERRQMVSLSKPYLENRQVLIVRSDSMINTRADLKGRVLGLQLGGSSDNYLLNDTNFAKSLQKVVKFKDIPSAMNDLVSNKLDAIGVDEINGRYFLSQKHGEFKILAEDIGLEYFGIGFRKGDASFQYKLEKALNQVMESKDGKEISRKWFGEELLLSRFLLRQKEARSLK